MYVCMYEVHIYLYHTVGVWVFQKYLKFIKSGIECNEHIVEMNLCTSKGRYVLKIFFSLHIHIHIER